MILVIDYGMGNLRSVEKALTHIGAAAQVSSDPALIPQAERIILPGVGAFDHAVIELKKRKLFDPLVAAIRGGKPYFGICLGLQLLFESSSEGTEKGFGILKGRVERFPDDLKVPHMGWNAVDFTHADCPYWKGIPAQSYFYFVHSYYAAPAEPAVVEGKTQYGRTFASAVWKDRVFATQFHPEKSQDLGLELLKNVVGAAR